MYIYILLTSFCLCIYSFTFLLSNLISWRNSDQLSGWNQTHHFLIEGSKVTSPWYYITWHQLILFSLFWSFIMHLSLWFCSEKPLQVSYLHLNNFLSLYSLSCILRAHNLWLNVEAALVIQHLFGKATFLGELDGDANKWSMENIMCGKSSS